MLNSILLQLHPQKLDHQNWNRILTIISHQKIKLSELKLHINFNYQLQLKKKQGKSFSPLLFVLLLLLICSILIFLFRYFGLAIDVKNDPISLSPNQQRWQGLFTPPSRFQTGARKNDFDISSPYSNVFFFSFLFFTQKKKKITIQQN